MPEYKCECCNFKTPIKCKFESHLETKKHLSNVNIMEEDKDKIIESLRQENMFLKGKVEAYEMMMKHFAVKEETTTETNYEPFVDDFLKSLELEVNDTLTESIAELRTIDDNQVDINLNNVYEAFVFNDKNNLPYIKSFSDISGETEHVVGDLIIEKVLKHCSIEITEPYKGRFKLYSKGKWLEVNESRDIVINMMSELYIHYKKYLKLLKFYYTYDSKNKCIDSNLCGEIQPILKNIQRQLNDKADTDEEIRYILNKLS